MIFKIFKDAFKETLVETFRMKNGGPVQWVRDNFIGLLVTIFALSSVLGWLTLTFVIVKTLAIVSPFGFLVFMAIGLTGTVCIPNFCVEVYEKARTKYNKYLADKKEIFERLSE